MKIVLIAGADSIHTVRWANGLSKYGHEVHVISQHPSLGKFDPLIKLHLLPFRGILGYFTMVPTVRKLINEIQPDIINAHYASGYGTTARRLNFHPFLLSVWGSDIYIFPYKSFLHKWFVKKNVLAADRIASTSFAMAEQIRKIVPSIKHIAITPFGVDIKKFENDCQIINNTIITIGTVKTMDYIYGIDLLIEAFSILLVRVQNRDDQKKITLKLRLVGSGKQLNEYILLTHKLNIQDNVEFIGQIDHADVPNELNKFDIYVALSRSESFGVAVLEAGAAGKPVVVSNVGGLPEVVIPNETGLIVKSDNVVEAADAIEKLILNFELRKYMSSNAKNYVAKNYSWDASVQKMIALYEETIQVFKNRNNN
jgi:glycosyltransferase involved in cell wall biosynthesis